MSDERLLTEEDVRAALRLEHVELRKLRRQVWWQRLPWWPVKLGRGVKRMRAADLDRYICSNGGVGRDDLHVQDEVQREAAPLRLHP